jgi:glycosyltransferase involved in cell wall biosynthesis
MDHAHFNESELALRTLDRNRVAIFIVAYNAEKYIKDVLKRIPAWVAEKLAEIYVIDDHSTDDTFGVAEKIEWPAHYAPLRIYRTPYNQGYGGNQRLGFLYAIERGFDIVVLLHGDGQYAPEALPMILAGYESGADAVFGSRFLKPLDAIKGGMPFYKWVGNRILTKIQNTVLGAKMSEMHSGYRSYRTSVLAKIPFAKNSLDFDFDADIIVQLHAAGFRVAEIPIPTYYGDEICHVNGMRYAWQCVKTSIIYRLMQYELFYDPKFDIRRGSQNLYTAKYSPTSLHYYIRNIPFLQNSRILDVGGGNGAEVGKSLAARGMDVTSIDQYADTSDTAVRQYVVDLDRPWASQFPTQFPIDKFDCVLALDVLEHLRSPELGVKEIFGCLGRNGKLYASTGNVAYLPLRIVLLFGWFNYGRRGILDMTHCRLFTIGSFKRMLKNAGFRVERVIGFGPPIADSVARGGRILNLVDRLLSFAAKKWPSMFAYQILAECVKTDSPADLMPQTFVISRDREVQSSAVNVVTERDIIPGRSSTA